MPLKISASKSWVLALAMWAQWSAAQTDAVRQNTASARVLSKDMVIQLTEQVDGNGHIDREFRRGTESLYRSRIQPLNQGFTLQVSAGHPSQLGILRLDASGFPWWTVKASLFGLRISPSPCVCRNSFLNLSRLTGNGWHSVASHSHVVRPSSKHARSHLLSGCDCRMGPGVNGWSS